MFKRIISLIDELDLCRILSICEEIRVGFFPLKKFELFILVERLI